MSGPTLIQSVHNSAQIVLTADEERLIRDYRQLIDEEQTCLLRFVAASVLEPQARRIKAPLPAHYWRRCGMINQPALLVNLAGAHMPPVALSVSLQFQFCVDAGALAATAFFDDLAAVGLHDHIACSMQFFNSASRAGMAASDDQSPATMQACTDAFAAGYLGRVQQELRLFHGERIGRNQPALDASMFTRSPTSH